MEKIAVSMCNQFPVRLSYTPLQSSARTRRGQSRSQTWVLCTCIVLSLSLLPSIRYNPDRLSPSRHVRAFLGLEPEIKFAHDFAGEEDAGNRRRGRDRHAGKSSSGKIASEY